MSAHSPDPLEPAIGLTYPIVIGNPKVVALEAELDIIWPGWRHRERFDGCAYDLKARIKWCLKRLSLLAEGLDYDVLIVRDSRNSQQCYAHPVLPATEKYEQVTREPPSPLGVPTSPVADVRLHEAAEVAALELTAEDPELTRRKEQRAVATEVARTGLATVRGDL